MNDPPNFNRLLKCISLLLIIFATPSTPLQILGLFPHPGLSHFHFFHPVMRTLANAGHDITVVSHFPDVSPPKNYKDLQLRGLPAAKNSYDFNVNFHRSAYIHFREFFILHDLAIEACTNALNSTAIRKVLDSKIRYDVIIMEQFNTDCMMAIAWKLQVPVIGLSSCGIPPWFYERFGNPLIPSYVPVVFLGHSDKMTFWQRISNWIAVHGLQFLYKFITEKKDNELIAKYLGPGYPPVGELAKTTSLIFINQHYSLSGPKPLSPAVIELGGIHVTMDTKPIDPAVLEILDNADHGVILVSFGSVVRSNSLPKHKLDAMLRAFGSFKQRILWKWENETLENKPPNVFIKKWLQQKEILCHPKLRVFWTHSGLLGISEAAHCGVPCVATPLFGDQFVNTAALIDRGMAVELDYLDITQETVERALRRALTPSMRENARRVSFSYRNRPKPVNETAVWWVEHVAATGGAPLIKSHSVYMNRFIYNSLDVYAVIFLCISCWIWSSIWILRKVCNRRGSGKVGNSKLKKQ